MESVPTQETEKQNPEEVKKELQEALMKDEEIKVPKYGMDEKSEEDKFSEFLTKSKPEDIYKSFQEGKYSYEDIMGGKVKADPSVLKYFSKEDWMKVHGVESRPEENIEKSLPEKFEEKKDLEKTIDNALDKAREIIDKENKNIQTEPKIMELSEEEKKKGYEIIPDTKEMTLEEVVKIAESFDKDKIEKELDKLPEKQREKISLGLNNLGFFVEEKKNKFFAKTFEFVSKGFDKKGTMGRFLTSLEENYTRDAGKTRQRMEEMKEGKMKQLSNVGYLAGNALKYGRIVADAVGYTFASPLRYVMMGGMMFSRGSEAAKEARLKNEKVIEKTRIKDIDQMADEAWKIYENAQKKAGEGEVKKEDLDKVYKENIPKDLMERLKKDPEPGVASGIIERIIKKDVGRSIKNIDKKLEKIEADKKLSAQEKEMEKEKIIKKYSEHLNSLDRMVSQYGTVDNLAMAAKYMETGSKALVKVMMVETLVLSLDKLLSSASEIFTHHGENIVVPQTGVLHEVVHQTPPIESTVEVKSGDNVWKIVDKQLEGRGYFKDLAGSSEEIMAKKTYIIDAIKDEIAKDPKGFGITSGDADKIMAGEKINLSSFFEKDAPNVKLGNIMEKAQGISKEDIASILSHKEAPKLIDDWDKSIFGSETAQPEIEPIHPETPIETPAEIHKPEIQDIPPKTGARNWDEAAKNAVYENTQILNARQAKEALNIQDYISSGDKGDWEKIKNMTYDQMSKNIPKFETRLNSIVARNASKLGFDASIRDGEKIGAYVERIARSTV